MELRVADVMTRRVETIEETTRGDFPSLLSRFRRFRHLPVVDFRGRIVGVLARTDLLERAARLGRRRPIRVGDLMSRPAVTVGEADSLESAAQLMLRSRVHSLPVVDANGDLVGVLTDNDLLSAMAGERLPAPSLEHEPVELLMTRDPVTVDPDAPLEVAAAALVESGIRHLPVVDADRRLVGILSERDLRSRIGADVRQWTHAAPSALQEPVSSVMTENPIALVSGTSLADALDAFSSERVGALPVVDPDDRLVGILSYVDMLRWLGEHAGAPEVAAPSP